MKSRRLSLILIIILLISCSSAAPALSPDGPWLIFAHIEQGSEPSSLWAVNADGSGLTQLTTNTIIAGPDELQAAAAPSGGRVAYITATDDYLHGLTLNLLALPSGQVQPVTSLTHPATEPPTDAATINDPAFNAVYAIAGMEKSLAWSPDGRQLAFVSAHEGLSADLYLYDTVNGSITRLTDQPDQVMLPRWSPDGRIIVFHTYTTFDLTQGVDLSGMWVITIADGQVIQIYDTPDLLEELFIGWIDSTSFLVYSRDVTCGWHNLRLVDLQSYQINPIWPEYFNKTSYDPDNNVLLVSVDSYTAACNEKGQSGLFRLTLTDLTPNLITDLTPVTLSWVDLPMFYGVTLDGNVWRITTDGEVSKLPETISFIPQISPDDLYWAWAGQDPKFAGGLYIGPIDAPPTPVYEGALTSILWTPDSTALFFIGDNVLYRLERDQPDDLQVIMNGVYLYDFRGAAWVYP